MNNEFELKVQALLDGQLAGRERRHVETRLASDETSLRLLEELRWTKDLLAGNEPTVALPESREFYWSKIRAEILRAEKAAVHPSAADAFLWVAWKKYLAPLSGFALVLFLVLGILRFYNFDASEARTRFLAQVESPSEEMGAFSFRSQTENIFVIWLYERPGHARSEVSTVKDMVIQ